MNKALPQLLCALLLTGLPAWSAQAQDRPVISVLEIFNIETGERSTVQEEKEHFEAPNWGPDGEWLLFNQGGNLYRLGLEDGHKEQVETGFANRCNNDHGISPDGKTIAFSHNQKGGGDGWLSSCIYTVPVGGGTPTQVTDKIPSFWHGWAPDGKSVAYTALRDDNFDVYTIPIEGGTETRLTSDDGLDDGPTFATDGKHIFYNSMASGTMEIWRMHPDGSNKEQLTNDDYSNWFAQPSPDGRHFVFISYLEDQGSSHPAMKEVILRLYDLKTNTIKVLCGFTGGQGSLNVPSWSPDGKRFAFVSYRYQ